MQAIKLLQTLRLNYRKAGKLIEAKAIARAIDVVRGGLVSARESGGAQ